jgi:glycosyltransferase involved in cell wall biosynthesis
VKPIRVGLVCDLREERWHSMDLIADMLLAALPEVAPEQIAATRLCPTMTRRWSRVPLVGGGARAWFADRLTGRLWDYPRWLAPLVPEFDVFHIIDHSYAHLVRVLPPERTIVTCNDVDAIMASCAGIQKTFDPMRFLSSRILGGLSQAAHVACISAATQSELLAFGRVNPERSSVVHLGVHPACSPVPVPKWDEPLAKRLGPKRFELLHVGSTIPRKRIDVLLTVLRGVRDVYGDARLLRVGDALTPSQQALAKKLDVADAIVEMRFLERPALAAVYRRASLALMTSDREGFGLPVVEAMACGTPVVASAIPSLQEVGGGAATYCPAGDVARWVSTVCTLLQQAEHDPVGWEMRKLRCVADASRFSWKTYAAEMAELYVQTFVACERASQGILAS